MQHPTVPTHFQPFYLDEIAELQARISDLRSQSASPRNAALIEEYAERIEEYEGVLAFDEDVVFAEVIEIASPAQQVAEAAVAVRVVAQILLNAARSERGAA